MIIDNYVEYDQDGYEIEYPIDYSEREYYVARYELVKEYAALINNSNLTSRARLADFFLSCFAR